MRILLNFMGEEFVAEVDYRVTFWGELASRDDPGAGPEWEIDSIYLYRDVSFFEPEPPWFEATGALFCVLANLEKINDAICESVYEDQYDNYD